MKIIQTKKTYEIFLKRKRKESKKRTKERKIIVDYREKNSLVPFELINLGLNLEFKELKVGDYLVKDVAIERKTVSDFISSMINKRLRRQLQELQQYKKRLLIIEGTEEQEIYNDGVSGVNGNAIRGFLISILLNYEVPIIFTKDSSDTAKFISVLEKKEKKESSLRAKKRKLTKKEQLEFILEGFPGVGFKKSKLLLKKFKNLKKVFNAKEESLKEILGKREEIFRKIIEEAYE